MSGEVQNAVIINYLEEIAECLVGNFYWKDKNGRYLGCNKSTLNMPGTDGAKGVIGRTDYDLWPDRADELRQNDIAVMESGKLLSFEETIQIGNRTKHYAVVKVPLRDSDGNIVGIIGNSLDITDRKEAESLRFQMREQERIKAISEQVAHDIRSPLLTLSMIVDSFKDVPESKRAALQSTIANICDIADNLLNRYRPKASTKITRDPYICVPSVLSEEINHKKCQYNRLNVKFNYFYDSDNKLVFIKGDSSVLARMISNLLNNAVEAFSGNSGIIDITVKIEDPYVKIIIKDNGRGIPPERLEKIRKNIPFAGGKKSGYGIGLEQVRGAVDAFSGRLLIESEEKIGTKVSVILPMAENPQWIADRIVLSKGTVVVILDDDPSVQHMWKIHFEKYPDSLSLYFFKNADDAIKFIESAENPDRIFFLCSFESGGSKNGIDVIKHLGICDRSVMITDYCNNKDVQNFSEQFNVPLLPKFFISSVAIVVKEESAPADVVIVDDDFDFSETLADFLRSGGISADVYNCPCTFKTKLFKYCMDTKILMDNDFSNCDMTGVELAEQLHRLGYSKLYILSGKNFDPKEISPYLKVLMKGNAGDILSMLSSRA
ncbi:MAG: PAS domain-containing sensor histidine kinase [Holosporaceae bacterium]|nr:PAS domain-containing sensor histidine kinase [Holosporaceae bacterium]